MNKLCNACQRELSIEKFSKRSKSKDGLACKCKDCDAKLQKEYRNKNTLNIKEKRKEYYHKNEIKFRNDRKEYYYNNLQIEKEGRTRWNKDNWLKKFIHGCCYKAEKKGIPYGNEADLYIHLKPIADIFKCEICNKPLNLNDPTRNDSPTIDKIIPEKGYVIGNVAILCHQCNRRKSDSSIEQLIQIVNWYQDKLNSIF